MKANQLTPFQRHGWKGLVILAVIYVALPIDLIPDMIPLLGQLDDAGVLIAVASMVFKWLAKNRRITRAIERA